MRLPVLILGLALILAGVVIRAADPYPLPQLRGAYFDSLQRMAPREPVDLPIRIVDIDEQSLQTVGQWPWPRTVLADLVIRLGELGAAVVVFDAIFAEPDGNSIRLLLQNPRFQHLLKTDRLGPDLAQFDNDRVFAEALSGMPVVLGTAAADAPPKHLDLNKSGFVLLGKDPTPGLFHLESTTGILPALNEAAAGIGEINVSPRIHNGIVQRVPLVWNTERGLVPSLSIEALRVALGENVIYLAGSPDIEGVVESVGVGDYTIPTSDDGQIWVRYRREDPRDYVSAVDVLQAKPDTDLAQRLEGHIVFVGASAAGLYDIRTTALGQQVPGVAVHGQIVEQILTENFFVRSDYIAGLELLSFGAIGILVTVIVSLTGAIASILAGTAAAVILFAGSWYGFSQSGVLFDVTFPVIGGMVNFAVISGYQFVISDRDKRAIRKSFSHYVAPEVLSEIESTGYKKGLSGEIREITVMFLDIRGFTAFSENRPPEQVVSVLNDLFTRLSTQILNQKGTIDKFIGDSIMAFWNAPLDTPDHARRSILSALEIRKAVSEFNAGAEHSDSKALAVAVGCATGDACVGNIGSLQRFNYSAIGDTVNTASRLEGACRAIHYDILVSASSVEQASGLAVVEAGSLELKGKSARTGVYIVIGDEAVAASKTFAEFREAYSMLLDALRTDAPEEQTSAFLEECRKLGRILEPGLVAYLDAIPDRSHQFKL